MTTPALTAFARGLTAEAAFDVLALARRLKAAGKDVIELQIGDSPFRSSAAAMAVRDGFGRIRSSCRDRCQRLARIFKGE